MITREQAIAFVREFYSIDPDTMAMLSSALDGRPAPNVAIVGLTIALLGANKSNISIDDLVEMLRAVDHINEFGRKLEELHEKQQKEN